MNKTQLEQYDRFLDENDWDIYYWATQSEVNNPASVGYLSAAKQGQGQAQGTDAWRQGAPRSGEWAQTVGAFKPAYRPVPQRWKDSEVLNLLRKHVRARSAEGVVELAQGTTRSQPGGTGLGRMPEVQIFD
jgi:hypothetical protein